MADIEQPSTSGQENQAALQVTLNFEVHKERHLTVLLFKNVANARELRELVKKGQISPEFAFIQAQAIPGLLVLHAAAHKALSAEASGTRHARSLHAELVYNLSGSKHVGEALKRFGIADDSTALLLARFDATPADVEHVKGLVQGEPTPLEQLPQLTDSALLQKYYKFSREELIIGSQEDAVVMRIVARECLQ